MMPRPRWCRLVGWLLCIVATSVMMVASTDATAAAQDDDQLDIASTTVYEPDLASESVEVQSTLTLINRNQNALVGDSVRWALPATAIDVEARSSGQALAVSFEDATSEDIVIASIALSINLALDQSLTVDMVYTVPGGEPRIPGARVNDSFFSFSVWATGDPGQSSVQVLIPDGFSMELQGNLDEFQRVTRDGQALLEATNIADPEAFFGRAYGRNDQGLITESVEISTATATIRAWPDDPAWAELVAGAIEDDVPNIEDLTGLEWPAGDIEIIETVTPYLYGYGGWFNTSSGRIEIGDNLERDVILHELGHAWFNDELIDGRWITEGLAEEFASRAIEASGDALPNPEQPDLSDQVRVPLAEWASPWTLPEDQAFAYEQYHYNASWWVLRQITDEVGLDQFAAVLSALKEDEITYRGSGPIERTQQPTSWVHLYDLLERQAGAQNLEPLFRDYVLGDAGAARLAERPAALERYDELSAAGNDWDVPLVIRRLYANWEFDEAQTMVELATDVLNQRDATDQVSAANAVTVAHEAQTMYQSAISTDDLERVLATELALADELAELVNLRADAQALATDRAIPVSFGEQPLDQARAETMTTFTALTELGETQDQVAATARSLAIANPAWPEIADTDEIETLQSLAEARLVALDAIEAAAQSGATAPTFTERIGQWRNNPNESVQRARSAFERGELTEVLEAASQAEAQVLGAARVGQNRVIGAVAVLSVVVVGLMASVWLLRKRRRLRHVPYEF